MLDPAGQERVAELMKRISRLKRKAAGDGVARAVLLEVIQIVNPLTDLPSKAVVRANLPALFRLRNGSLPLRVDISAEAWGGRQDVDLVALYIHHRAQFEQVYRLLSDWWVAHQAEALRFRRQTREEMRQPLMAELGTDDESEEEVALDPDLGTPFADTLSPIVTRFNQSEQTREDYTRTITSLRNWLGNVLLAEGQAPWPPLTEAQRQRIEGMLRDLLRVYDSM